jgi:hypothetical protein
LFEVAEGLGLIGQSVEAVVRRLDFNYSTLGVLENRRFGITARASGLREEPAVGHAGALIAELGREEDRGLQLLTSRV